MRTHSTTLGSKYQWRTKFDQFPETPETSQEPPLDMRFFRPFSSELNDEVELEPSNVSTR